MLNIKNKLKRCNYISTKSLKIILEFTKENILRFAEKFARKIMGEN